MINIKKTGQNIHNKLQSLFFIYLIVGGMPDAVKTYISIKDIREVDKIQRDIYKLYKADLTQQKQQCISFVFQRYRSADECLSGRNQNGIYK